MSLERQLVFLLPVLGRVGWVSHFRFPQVTLLERMGTNVYFSEECPLSFLKGLDRSPFPPILSNVMRRTIVGETESAASNTQPTHKSTERWFL